MFLLSTITFAVETFHFHPWKTVTCLVKAIFVLITTISFVSTNITFLLKPSFSCDIRNHWPSKSYHYRMNNHHFLTCNNDFVLWATSMFIFELTITCLVKASVFLFTFIIILRKTITSVFKPSSVYQAQLPFSDENHYFNIKPQSTICLWLIKAIIFLCHHFDLQPSLIKNMIFPVTTIIFQVEPSLSYWKTIC